ncbi:Potassium voltage-gated channel subfamily H member 2 [Anabarilius grahami]|uniref:Potassium voltage-gated channel subfamily H member 2 n=1 Tax=Anabarilius grahami TaxID=495550 RepID=A0A3N0XKT7_ANAGA|nr:Potassium voltage-gated channel subfamily H member 2 [Anabarilius grahami]
MRISAVRQFVSRFFCLIQVSVTGVCFLCLVDVVPVKNEDGVVIMFILNFEVMPDDKLHDAQDLNHKLPLLWRHSNRARGIRLRLPLLNSRNNSKSSLREDPEAGRGTGFPSSSRGQSHESLPLGELLSLPEHKRPRLATASTISTSLVTTPPSLLPEDQRNLLGSDPSSPPPAPPHPATLPLGQSSPRPQRLNPDASVSNCSLTNSRSRESFHSMRRASSVDDIEAMRPQWDRKYRTRPTCSSTGAMNNKSSILNSTSDSDLMRYRAISKIPQITLNFVDFKPDPLIALPAGEMDIIAPCKLIDRTHNVTEKVTQHSYIFIILFSQCAVLWRITYQPVRFLTSAGNQVLIRALRCVKMSDPVILEIESLCFIRWSTGTGEAVGLIQTRSPAVQFRGLWFGPSARFRWRRCSHVLSFMAVFGKTVSPQPTACMAWLSVWPYVLNVVSADCEMIVEAPKHMAFRPNTQTRTG